MIVKIMTAAFFKGADYGLRMFPLPHGDALRTVQTLDWTDAQGHPTDAAPIMDSEAEDPVLRLPADSAEGELLESTVLDSSYLQVSWGPRQDDERSYFIMNVEHSGTAPDDWWEIRLRLDPFAHLESMANLTGRWDATPERNDAMMPFIVSNDTKVPGRSYRLPALPRYNTSTAGQHQLFFIKITASEYVGLRPDGHIYREQDTPATYYMLGLAGELSYQVPFDNKGETWTYPSISELMGSIDDLGVNQYGETFGFTPSTILDISISERAPVQVNADRSMTDAGLLLQITTEKGIYAHRYFDSVSRTEKMHKPSFTAAELFTATASIHTANDDTLSAVPLQVLVSEDISVRSVSDTTGLYTEVSIGDSHIMMPEGKLPYVGSAWAEYAIAQQSYDRENMTLAIQNAKSEAVQNTAMGAANGIISGALIGGPLGLLGGVATTALNAGGSVMELARNERTARQQQDMHEKMLQNSVGTAYNTGYGLEYIRKSDEGRCRIQLDVPQHLTQQMFNDYVKWHGYPAGGLESAVVLKQGYIQGYITDMTMSKRERDRMNRELTEGVRFV